MKTIACRLLFILSLSALALSGCPGNAPDPNRLPAVPEQDLKNGAVTVAADQALVIYVSGTVKATHRGMNLPVAAGDLLSRWQSVKTDPLSSCELQFGGGTAIRIEESTELYLESILVEDGRREISAAMKSGTLLCKVQKLSGSESFRIKTPTANCGVRGTEFGVTITARNDTLLAVNEGTVSLFPAALDPARLAADLATGDPVLDAAIAGLTHAERLTGAGQSAVLTQAAARQAAENRSRVENEIREIKRVSGTGKATAAQLAGLHSVIASAKAEIGKRLPSPRPQTDAERDLTQGLDGLKQHMLKSVRVETEKTGAVTLRVWSTYPRADEPDSSAYAQNLVENFEKHNPAIKIDWNTFADKGFNERVAAALIEKRGPDVFQTRGGRFFEALAADGRLLDLTAELSSISSMEIAKRAMSYGGRQYGIAPYFSILGLHVNEDIFKRYGLTVPSTVDELEAAAEALKAHGLQPLASGAKDEWPILEPFMYLVNRRGGDVYTRLVERKIGFASEPFVWAGRKIQEWSKKGYFGNAPLEETYFDAVARMKNGEAAMWVCGSWLCRDFPAGGPITFHPFPTVTGGQGDIHDVVGMTEIGFIAAQSSEAKRKAIAAFFNYVMTEEACRWLSSRICTVPGAPLSGDLFEPAMAILAKTKRLIPWWDQDLPPEVAYLPAAAVKKLLVEGTDAKARLAECEAQLAQFLGPLEP